MATIERNDPRVRRVMLDLIVQRGLSYRDAIEECERRAEELAAPYLKVAELLRAELDRGEDG